jgi:hypothetical protein
MTVTIPIGTLTQKIQCHDTPWVMAPPTTGPTATARPPMPPHAPSASGRFSGEMAAGQDRQRERHRDRAAEALQGAGGDQHPARRRERRGRGTEREDRDADGEHAAAAEAVAEGRAHQEQGGEGECVGVDRPFEIAEGRAQVAPDDRQGHGHDEVVQADHEEGDRDYREGPESRCSTVHRMVLSLGY